MYNGITIKFRFNRDRLGLALLDHYYRQDDVTVESLPELLKSLKKSEAKKILKSELFHYGCQGEYHAGYFEAADDVGQVRIDMEELITVWLDKNYPQ